MTLNPDVLDTLTVELVRLEAAAEAMRDLLRLYGRDPPFLEGSGAIVVEAPARKSLPASKRQDLPGDADVDEDEDEKPVPSRPLAPPPRLPRAAGQVEGLGRRAPRVPLEAIERAQVLFGEGQDLRRIGQAVGVSGQTVSNWAVKYGWARQEQFNSRLKRGRQSPRPDTGVRITRPPSLADRELQERIEQEERERDNGGPWVVLPAKQADPSPPASTAEPKPTPLRRCECGQLVALDPCPLCQRPWENAAYRAKHQETQ